MCVPSPLSVPGGLCQTNVRDGVITSKSYKTLTWVWSTFQLVKQTIKGRVFQPIKLLLKPFSRPCFRFTCTLLTLPSVGDPPGCASESPPDQSLHSLCLAVQQVKSREMRLSQWSCINIASLSWHSVTLPPLDHNIRLRLCPAPADTTELDTRIIYLYLDPDGVQVLNIYRNILQNREGLIATGFEPENDNYV